MTLAVLDAPWRRTDRQSGKAASTVRLSPTASFIQDATMDQRFAFQPHGKMLAALSLAPFVAVAWAEAGVDDAERALVLSWAAELGLTKGEPGYALLEHWLSEPPASHLLETWKRHYVDALSRSLSSEAKKEFKRHVMRRARELVQTASDLSSVDQAPSGNEHAVMGEIDSALS